MSTTPVWHSADLLRPIVEADLELLTEREKDHVPTPGPETHFYELYPYSLASYHPATEWGTLYRKWQEEMPVHQQQTMEGNTESDTPPMLIAMMDVEDGYGYTPPAPEGRNLISPSVTKHQPMNKDELIESLNKMPRLRVIGLGKAVLDGTEGIPLPPVWTLQILFTNYEVSPKFLDVFLGGEISPGSHTGVLVRNISQPYDSKLRDLHYQFELIYPTLSNDGRGNWIRNGKAFYWQRVGIYVRYRYFNESSTVFLGPQVPELLMRRLEEGLRSTRNSRGVDAMFLIPLLALSYAVQEWRVAIGAVFEDADKSSAIFFEIFDDISLCVENLAGTVNDFFLMSGPSGTPGAGSNTEESGDPAAASTSQAASVYIPVQQAFRNLQREVSDLMANIHRIECKAKRSLSEAYHIREVRNTENIENLLADSKQQGDTMMSIASATRSDGERMKMIAIVTMLYAPGAYFSSIIGSDLVETTGGRLSVGSNFMLYLALTIIFTVLTGVLVGWPILRDYLYARIKQEDKEKAAV